VFLAISALVAIYMDPTQLGNSRQPTACWDFYMGNSILVLMLLRRRKAVDTASFRVLVHAADIVWPAFISVFARRSEKPVFLFFVFVLTAAAYRWGLWETLSTAGAEVVLLWTESFLLHVWAARGQPYPGIFCPACKINTTEFEPKRLFMLSVYLLVMGLLLGYLSEQQKHLRAEKAVVTRMLSKVRVEAGLTGTLQQICREIVTMYGAERLLVASQEIHSHRAFSESCAMTMGRLPISCGWTPARGTQRIYLEDFPGEAFYATSEGDRWSVSRWTARAIRCLRLRLTRWSG
jgi:hypothetical protein